MSLWINHFSRLFCKSPNIFLLPIYVPQSDVYMRAFQILAPIFAHIEIAYQIFLALEPLSSLPQSNLLVTGGGAFNTHLVQRISDMVLPLGVTVTTPDADVVMYKEAVIMALLGLLRWREENTTLHSATGASRSSIGGAVWMGQMA
jgi:tRNA A37 threonylcarbamoyltransferase TsaD